MPESWLTSHSRGVLGGSLMGQMKHVEAERLLAAGYGGMKQREDKIPAEGKRRLKEVLRRVLELYEATNQPEKASEFR
jgi:eukaryotic-like serine/threonine-protein kinase